MDSEGERERTIRVYIKLKDRPKSENELRKLLEKAFEMLWSIRSVRLK